MGDFGLAGLWLFLALALVVSVLVGAAASSSLPRRPTSPTRRQH
jgi:hypothetical protein